LRQKRSLDLLSDSGRSGSSIPDAPAFLQLFCDTAFHASGDHALLGDAAAGILDRVELLGDAELPGEPGSRRRLRGEHSMPKIEVNPETYEVRADRELLTCAPAEVLPMAQRYFMF
jgi:hypothetical protein